MADLTTWPGPEVAIIAAVKLACGVEDVVKLDDKQPFNRKRRVELSFSFAPSGTFSQVFVPVDGGAQSQIRGQLSVTVFFTILSQSHTPDVSAEELAIRAIVNVSFDSVVNILAAENLALNGPGAFSVSVVQRDQRMISVQVGTWELTLGICLVEGGVGDVPPGQTPRPFIDRVGLDTIDAPRRRSVSAAALDDGVKSAATWRSIWTGTQTDLIAGRRWADGNGTEHNLTPSATIGDETLDRVTVVSGTGLDVANDPDAGVWRDSWAMVLILRGSAPTVRSRVLSKASGSTAGYRLDAQADGSLQLVEADGTVVLTVGFVLDGSSWVTVVMSQIAGTISLRTSSESSATSAIDLFVDVPLRLGDEGGSSWPAGVELALLGEATEVTDATTLLTAVKSAVGL